MAVEGGQRRAVRKRVGAREGAKNAHQQSVSA